MLEIPLTSDPEQLFSVVINSQKYNCRVLLNSRTGTWTLSLSIGSTPVATGVPLLGGVDIFSRFNIGIKNVFVVNLESPTEDPTRSNLGSGAKLFILTDSEVASLG